MSRNHRRAFCGLLIAGGAVAGTAVAATPENGTVSNASPRIAWAGEVTASWTPSRAVIAENAAGADGTTPCEAPTCDTFKLTVADPNDLSIGADGPGEASDPDQLIIRIKKPDESYLTTIGEGSKGKPLVIKFKKAAKGDYIVDYWNYYVSATTPYDAFAQLGTGTTGAPAGGTDTTAGGTAGGGTSGGSPGPTPQGPGSAPAARENIDIKVKASKTSARKLKKTRKLTAKVTVSRQVAKITAFLRKGKKVVAKGKRGTTTGTAKLKLKLSKKAAKKVRKGKYKLTVVADDGKGTTASKTIKVRVRK